MILSGYIDESFSGKQQEGIFTLCCVFVQQNMLAWLEEKESEKKGYPLKYT